MENTYLYIISNYKLSLIGRGGPAGRSPFGGRGGNMNNALKKLITTNSFMLGGRGASFGGRGGSPGRGNYKFNKFFLFLLFS